MRRGITRLGMLAALPAACLLVATPDARAQRPGEGLIVAGEAPQLELLYTGDVIGYVDPCGWKKNPAGGLARRAWLIDQLKSKFPGSPLLLVDSGNFSDHPTPEGDVKTRGLVEGMGKLGYAAANVGDRDLSVGYDEFIKRIGRPGFDLVSANVVRQDTGKPVFKPYTVVRVKSPDGKSSLRVGILGAARYNPLFLKAGPDNSNLVIAKPETELVRYIKEVRKQSDLVVLLAALHKEEAKRIVAAVPGIDVVVGSYGGIVTTSEERAGQTLMVYSGNQGKRIGETRIYLDGKKIVSTNTAMYMLTRAFPADPQMLDFVAQVVGEVQRLKQQARPAALAGVPASR